MLSKWLKWARSLQVIARNGPTVADNRFDPERRVPCKDSLPGTRRPRGDRFNMSGPASNNVHHPDLERGSLKFFKRVFMTLPSPDPLSLQGVFQGEFVGPAWLQRSVKPALALGGLGAWWGKEFDGTGRGINIVQRGESFERVVPMLVKGAISLVDGKTGVTLLYPPGSPFPLTWIVDELRQLDEGRLLGLAMVNRAWLRRFVFPFLLHHREHWDGL